MHKILTLLGFARKSGSLVCGETLCAENIKRHKVSLLIIAEDINETTRNKMVQLCESEQISYRILASKEALSEAIGKHNYGLFGVTNKKFSRALIEKIDAL